MGDRNRQESTQTSYLWRADAQFYFSPQNYDLELQAEADVKDLIRLLFHPFSFIVLWCI